MPVAGAVTLEQALGPVLGARVTAIVAQYPPAPGDLVELAPDQRSARWRDATGQWHVLEFLPPIDEIDDDDDDDGEDDDTGWENESDESLTLKAAGKR